MKKKLNPFFSFAMGAMAVAIGVLLAWFGQFTYTNTLKFAENMQETQATVVTVYRTGRRAKRSKWNYTLKYEVPGLTLYSRLNNSGTVSFFGKPNYTEGQVITVRVNPDYKYAYLPTVFYPVNLHGGRIFMFFNAAWMLFAGFCMMGLPFMPKKKKIRRD